MGRKRRITVDREQEQSVRRRPAAAEQAPDHPVLTLQRSAGNQAVAQAVEVARDSAGTAAPVKTIGTITIEGPDIGTITFPIEKVVDIGSGYALRAPHTSDEAEIRRLLKPKYDSAGNAQPNITQVKISYDEDKTIEMTTPKLLNYDGADKDTFRFELQYSPGA